MSNNTIGNAKDIPLNLQRGTLPDVSGALRDYFQLLTFTIITKSTIAFQVKETSAEVSFWGFIKSLTGTKLLQKPEGQRDWNWFHIYAQFDANSMIVNLKTDDIVVYNSMRLRIMSKKNVGLYGYIDYEAIEDYIPDEGD